MAAHGPDAAPGVEERALPRATRRKHLCHWSSSRFHLRGAPGAASAKPVAPSVGGGGPQREWSPALSQARCPWGCG